MILPEAIILASEGGKDVRARVEERPGAEAEVAFYLLIPDEALLLGRFFAAPWLRGEYANQDEAGFLLVFADPGVANLTLRFGVEDATRVAALIEEALGLMPLKPVSPPGPLSRPSGLATP